MIDETTYNNALLTLKHYIDDKALCLDIIDSFSGNQRASKSHLIDVIMHNNILSKDYEVVVWGAWYGSLLAPIIAPKVKHLSLIDLDASLADPSGSLLKHLVNTSYIVGDVFSERLSRYHDTNLVINTSCEHMKPLRDFPWIDDFDVETYFALQSNNMFNIPTHTNCVNSIEEFIDQLPPCLEIVYTDSIKVPGWEHDNGERYTILARKTF